MSWTHDICLSCDNQTQDGAKFCSQQCRLLDMERGAGYSSGPQTPAAVSGKYSPQSYGSWQVVSTSSQQHQPFQLSPAVNFSSYRQQPSESPPSSPRSRSTHQSASYFSQHAAAPATSQTSQRGLTLSPSRSSLSSVSSNGSNVSSPGLLSEETSNLLRDYSGAFDQTRTWKRRTTHS